MRLKIYHMGLLVTFLFIFTIQALAQQTITGKVIDANTNEALPGVDVLVKNTVIGTTTNSKGIYKLNVKSLTDTLLFSYIGYKTSIVPINGRTSIDISLQPKAIKGGEVVVIGYGSQERKYLVGSITSVKPSQIESRPITNVTQAMVGAVPGLNIQTPSAAIGSSPQISIRGVGSINAGYSPLFVVDGFPVSEYDALSVNPSDIASVEVLKDASATAIYGARGANGVILITTKKGKGKPEITVNVNTGDSYVPQSARVKVLNAKEYVTYYKEYFNNVGQTVPSAIANWNGKTNTNWQDLVYRVAPFENYSVSASGGTPKLSYLVSGGYIDHQGAVIASGEQEYTGRMNVEFRPSNRVTLGLSVAPNYHTTHQSATDGSDFGSLTALAIELPPILPLKNADGSYTTGADLGYGKNLFNPLMLSKASLSKTFTFESISSLYIAIEPLKGLTIKSTIGANYIASKLTSSFDSPAPKYGVSALSIAQSQELNWQNRNTIHYKRNLNKDNTIGVLVGLTLQSDKTNSINASVSNFGGFNPISLGFGDIKSLNASQGFSGNTLISYLGRLNYAFKDKYLLTATVRKDGSSRFGIYNRYHTFGSIGVGWRLSQEPFIQKLKFVSNAKLRISYGSTGNNSISDFEAIPTLNIVNTAIGNAELKGVVNGTPGNPNLTWELSKQFDGGLDLGFLNQRINLTIDYYRNITSSLLLAKNLPPSSGFSSILTNIGSMRNSGIEVNGNFEIINKNDLTWTIGGNVSHNVEKVLNLGGVNKIANFYGALQDVIGYPLDEIQAIKAIGIVQQGQHPAAQPNAKPGDILFLDKNKDGQISDFLGPDAVYLGSSNPSYIYGINTNISYKNFSLLVNLDGQYGGVIQDLYLIQVGAPFQLVNLSKKMWYDGRYVSASQPGNGHTPAPGALLGSANAVGTVSSLGVQSTNFLTIRNVTLSYDVPNSFRKHFGVNRVRIFTSIENLYTFTSFIGGNPETIAVRGLNTAPSMAIPRVWTVGIKLSF